MACDMSSGSSRGEIRVPSLPVRHTDAAYDDYLDSVLYDYGIQFSPGGSGIVEIEEALSPAQVEEEEEETAREIKPLNLKTEARRSDSDGQDAIKFEKRPLVDANHESDDVGGGRPPTRRLTGSARPVAPPRRSIRLQAQRYKLGRQDVALTIDESKEVTSPRVQGRKKIKLYQQAPLEDPEKERRRFNAILAKRNRDMKKRQIQCLEEQVRKLRHVNTQCNKVMRRTNSDIQRLRQDLQTAKAASAQLTDMAMSKDREIRQQREKLLLFQGHLDLIGTSLDDDNPARRLIFALNQRLSCQSPIAGDNSLRLPDE